MTTSHRLSRTHDGVVRLLAIGAVLLIIAGCATAPSRDAIPPFRQGVVTVDQQTSATFADVNSFLRRQQIERAMTKEALTEELFFEALASADLTKWDRAFALIDSYAEKIERLLNPDQRSGVEGELSVLGEKIEALREEQLPAGISAAFTKFGGLLVKLKVEHDALEAIRKADPAIQEVFSAMMEAIGADPQAGVRGTVRTSWTQVLARIDVRDFRRASSDDAKRAAVLRYVEALDERDVQDRLLDSLRLSLATLAKAHQDLAHGRRGSAETLIQLIQDEYKAYQEELKVLRERREGGLTSGGTT
ncbi:hypothetical protein [Pseudomonas putida]|uniref:hypothetical protein n=1 Tax=Pseudomonas putida TaxID=303 RepID=UPI0022710074|nr:hypothetical protein [Pseudomonas putida]MDD2147428.1 hypothetical protein [Pseudomonas putida]HDS1705766.1 hypothetical protein [Pseudomonas putida]